MSMFYSGRIPIALKWHILLWYLSTNIHHINTVSIIYSFIFSIVEPKIFQLMPLVVSWLCASSLTQCQDKDNITYSAVHLQIWKSHFLTPLLVYLSVSTSVTRHEIIHNCCCLLDVIMAPFKPYPRMAKLLSNCSSLTTFGNYTGNICHSPSPVSRVSSVKWR